MVEFCEKLGVSEIIVAFAAPFEGSASQVSHVVVCASNVPGCQGRAFVGRMAKVQGPKQSLGHN